MLTRLVLFCSGLVFFRVLTSSRVCSATSTDSPPRFPNEISMTSLQLVTSPQSQSQSASSLFPPSPSSPCSLQKQELDIQSHFILTWQKISKDTVAVDDRIPQISLIHPSLARSRRRSRQLCESSSSLLSSRLSLSLSSFPLFAVCACVFVKKKYAKRGSVFTLSLLLKISLTSSSSTNNKQKQQQRRSRHGQNERDDDGANARD